jgi:NAD+ kinase
LCVIACILPVCSVPAFVFVFPKFCDLFPVVIFSSFSLCMKRIGLYANTTKPDAVKWAERAARFLTAEKAEFCVQREIASLFEESFAKLLCFDKDQYDSAKREARSDKAEKPDKIFSGLVLDIEDYEKFCDVIVSFGGDGTMLRAARAVFDAEIPIMGINLGTLGFLAEFSASELESALWAVLSGEYHVEDRAVIEARIGTLLPPEERRRRDDDDNDDDDRNTSLARSLDVSELLYACNDIVIHKKNIIHLITVRASVDGYPIADYRADGLILTTPTGSTAYSLSSGGPIIVPTCQALCLTPISPHSLNLRPLVIPDTSEICLEIIPNDGLATLIADGTETVEIKPGEKIVITKSDRVMKLLKRENRSYYDLLKKKLLWSANGK